jgi:hypothetical protein
VSLPNRLNARLARDLTSRSEPDAWRLLVWLALSRGDDNLLASLAAEHCLAGASKRPPSVMAALALAKVNLP